MEEYRMYTPSAEGYKLFRENLKKTNPIGLNRELELLKDFSDNPENTDEAVVERRVRKLNKAYSTRISAEGLNEIKKLILQPGFDAELDRDGYMLVEKLRRVPSSKTEKGWADCLSFATKYCHHCRPDKYPIYDSVNVRALTVCIGYEDKRDYAEYVKCFKAFCSALGFEELKGNEGFYIDKYIQVVGIHDELLFPIVDKK